MLSLKSIVLRFAVHRRSLAAVLAVSSLLLSAVLVGCSAGGMQGDALKYAQLEQDFNNSGQRAEQLRASGDEKGYLKELIDNAQPIGKQMLSIREKYKSVSDTRDSEFMQAVEDAKSSLR